MNISPELYNNSNYLQRRDGKRLVQRIIDDLQDMHFDTIVDIGCGTGNITDELALKLPHNRIIGLDINESMVHYAQQHYERPSVRYLTADICEEWDKLNSKLDLPENSVDLIVSIYCLHWVSDLDQAMKNINKLLKPGTRITTKTRETIRKLSEHLAPFPVFEQPKEEQLLMKWQQSCVDNGLLMPETVLTHTYYRFDNLKQFRNELQALCHFLPFIPEDKRDDFLKEYFQLVDDQYVAKQFETRELTEDSMVKLRYDYIIVVATNTEQV